MTRQRSVVLAIARAIARARSTPRASILVVSLSPALLIACDDPRGPLDLDAIDEPNEPCVAVVHEALELGPAVHRYIADSSGSSGGWALATVVGEADATKLVLVRVPASPDELLLEPIEFSDASLTPADIELRTGTSPGELWVLQDSGSLATLSKLAPGVGVVEDNGSIGNFPIADGSPARGCPHEYSRQLLLIEGRPYILALPDCSESPALDLELLELDPDTLSFASTWGLGFNACIDDPECAIYPHRLDPIRPGDSSQVANAERVAVGFSQVRDFGIGLTSSDVSLLELRMSAGTPTARLVTFRQVWLTTTDLGPVQLAQDPFSIELHVRNGGSAQDAALLRFDAIGELYVQIKTPQLLPFGGPGQLVQLETQAAMVRVRDAGLEVIPLIDVGEWPVWDPQIVYELDDLVSVEPAGVGQLLLRREQAPPRIIALRCLD